jgi:hypothetical protein
MKRNLILLAFSVIGWWISAAVMGAGISILGPGREAVLTRVLAMPLIYAWVTWTWFNMYKESDPKRTAVIVAAVYLILEVLTRVWVGTQGWRLILDVAGFWLPLAVALGTVFYVGRWMAARHSRKES